MQQELIDKAKQAIGVILILAFCFWAGIKGILGIMIGMGLMSFLVITENPTMIAFMQWWDDQQKEDNNDRQKKTP